MFSKISEIAGKMRIRVLDGAQIRVGLGISMTQVMLILSVCYDWQAKYLKYHDEISL